MRCYRCGKPATKFVNTAIGVAVTAALILESACDDAGRNPMTPPSPPRWRKREGRWRCSANAESGNQSSASDNHWRFEIRRSCDFLVGALRRARTALATINAALGRVEAMTEYS